MQLHIIANKPGIAGELNVFNAPRPIPGIKVWEGDFLHGIYYSANPLMTKELMHLDAWQIIYYNIRQARDILLTAYKQYKEKIIDLEEKEVRRIFNYLMNRKT